MFDLRRIPIVRVLFPFAGGALTGFQILRSIQILEVLLVLVSLWVLLLVIFWFTGKKPWILQWLFSLLAFFLFFFSGVGTGSITRPVDPGLPMDQKVMIRGEICDGPKSGKRNWSYGVDVEMVCTKDTAFSVNTHLKVYTHTDLPLVGETWQFYGQLVSISNSGNPGAPDYRAIMGRKNCWYRFYTDPVSFSGRQRNLTGQKIRMDPKLSAARIRSAVSDYWSGGEKEIALLKAVCLGDRSDLTDDIRQAYTAAGGMHLLAVSGLHVGLIWWVLQHAFSWMVRLSGKEVFRSIAIITLLWFFAFITGFSSSVCRSVTMFTFLSIGRLMEQRTNALNGILVSAFILIVIYPPRLLDVGFQLSYSAILGIVVLFPIFRGLLKVKLRVLKWFWEAMMVSLAAQLSTAPLVIYYFHQIPIYSLFTSLLAIPILSVLITVFVVSVPFMFTGVFTGVFNELLIRMARLMNLSMEMIASVPGAVIGELQLNRISLFLLISILLLVMISLHKRSSFPRYLLVGLVSMALIWSTWIRYERYHSSEMMICHFRNASQVTFREGDQVDHFCWYRDSSSISYVEQYRSMVWSTRLYENRVFEMQDMMSAEGSNSACLTTGPGIWSIGNDHTKGWVISDSVRQYRSGMVPGYMDLQESGTCDFILLTGNPSTWYIPEALLMESGDLIIDGSNRNWYIRHFDLFREEVQHVDRVHKTVQNGAYLKRW